MNCVKKIALLIFLTVSTTVWSQKVIEYIVPFGIGGPTDVMARMTADYLNTRLDGSTVVVVNKTGASGQIAFNDSVSKDRFNMLSASTTNFISNRVMHSNQENPLDKVNLIGPVVDSSYVIVTTPESGIKTLSDFKKLKEVTCSGAIFSTTLAAKHMFKQMGIDNAFVVQYPDSATVKRDLMAKVMPCTVDAVSSWTSLYQAGKVNIIGVMSDTRLPVLPEVPTTKELGVDMTSYLWIAIAVPKKFANTADFTRIQKEIANIHNDPEFRTKAINLGFRITTIKPDFEKDVELDYQKWESVRKKLKIEKVD